MNLKSPLWRRCYLHLRWYFYDDNYYDDNYYDDNYYDDNDDHVHLQMGELGRSDVDAPLPPRSKPIFTATAISAPAAESYLASESFQIKLSGKAACPAWQS